MITSRFTGFKSDMTLTSDKHLKAVRVQFSRGESVSITYESNGRIKNDFTSYQEVLDYLEKKGW